MGSRCGRAVILRDSSSIKKLTLEQEWKQVVKFKPPAVREAWLRQADVIAALTAKVCSRRQRNIQDLSQGASLLAPTPYWFRTWLYGGETPPMQLRPKEVKRITELKDRVYDADGQPVWKGGKPLLDYVISRKAAKFIEDCESKQGKVGRMRLSRVATRGPNNVDNADRDISHVVVSADNQVINQQQVLTPPHLRFYPAMAVDMEDNLDGADEFGGDADHQYLTHNWLHDDSQRSVSAEIIRRIADAGGTPSDGLTKIKDDNWYRGGTFWPVLPKKDEL